MTNQVNNQSFNTINWRDKTHLTLKMTTARVVETSVTVNNNSPIQDYGHQDDHTQPTYKKLDFIAFYYKLFWPFSLISLFFAKFQTADCTKYFQKFIYTGKSTANEEKTPKNTVKQS